MIKMIKYEKPSTEATNSKFINTMLFRILSGEYDLGKWIREAQVRLPAELKEQLKEYCNAISNEIKMLEAADKSNDNDDTYTASRKLFLTTVLDAFDIYLYEDMDKPVQNPALCIIAYFLECDGTISSVTMSENNVLNIASDKSNTSNIIMFMVNHFSEMLMKMNTPNSIELLLASILKR